MSVNFSISMSSIFELRSDLLSESYESLKLVIYGIDNMISEDFLTIDLVNAYECLGRIIGEEVSDDVIKEVFEKFCMGK